MDRVVADYYEFEQECLRREDPSARAGPEGLHPMGYAGDRLV